VTPQDTELTVRQLRWILAHATDDANLPEALSEFADAERLEAEAIAHNDRQRVYFEYLERRREREREHVQRAADDAKQAAIAAGPISRDNAYLIYKEAADAERVRFEIREPRLDFQEWLDAGKPAVHQIRGIRELQAHRLEAAR
jgi:hypothetical protein